MDCSLSVNCRQLASARLRWAAVAGALDTWAGSVVILLQCTGRLRQVRVLVNITNSVASVLRACLPGRWLHWNSAGRCNRPQSPLSSENPLLRDGLMCLKNEANSAGDPGELRHRRRRPAHPPNLDSPSVSGFVCTREAGAPLSQQETALYAGKRIAAYGGYCGWTVQLGLPLRYQGRCRVV